MFKELTNEQVKKWKYPGGEVGIRALSDLPDDIVWRIQSSDDLINLCMLRSSVMYREELGFKKIYIPYMPYARQDRVSAEGDSLSIEVFSEILRKVVRPSEIHTLDLHSNTGHIILNKCGKVVNHSPVKYIKEFLVQAKVNAPITFVSPDAGAKEKTSEYAKECNTNGVVYCGKKRDPDTGKLCGFTIDRKTHGLYPNALVITDDICDGGGTFIGLAEVLRAEYPKVPLYLFTTHGIYSQGLEKLGSIFEKIGSTNSFVHGFVAGVSSDKLITTEIDFEAK